MARDTVELMLQNADGKWAGSGLGDIWDNQIRFKQNLRFPMKGHYEFSVIQAMQMENLPAIMEVGMRIEKFEKP
jgi:gliding motility-associated lipoprotein GldH